MQFNLQKSIPILERTPIVIKLMLEGLGDEWIMNNEGPETWSPYDIIGHLIHGENNDWITRIRITLQDVGDKKYQPYNRTAMFKESNGKSLEQLLTEFEYARKNSLKQLTELNIQDVDLDKTATS